MKGFNFDPHSRTPIAYYILQIFYNDSNQKNSQLI